MDRNLSRTSALVAEYRRSPFAMVWQKLWKKFPSFSVKHSPFFIFEDGAVLWNQGFGNIAYLKGNRSVTIQWALEGGQQGARIIHLSAVRQWDSPHENEKLDQAAVEELRNRLTKRFRARGENVVFQ